MNPEGEYNRWVHLFSLIEQHRADNPGVHIGEHYVYPWPAPIDPTWEYIEAVYNLTRFKQWPRAWLSFYSEIALCSDIATVTDHGWKRAVQRDNGLALKMTGPYLLCAKSMGQITVSQPIVEMKRVIRKKYAVLARGTEDDQGIVHNEIAAKIKSYYAPYLLREVQNPHVLEPPQEA